MRIGYACQCIGVPFTDFKSCILKNVTEDTLVKLINHNLNSLENIIDYNIKNKIYLFRITSDLIPFGSSFANSIPWWDIFESKLKLIGEKINASGIRVSMHPGQYTVLNSPNKEVVGRAVDDLIYHTRVLDSLGLNSQHKIVLHIGGIYNDKISAINRFIENYNFLSDSVKKRLVIENDDKLYTINDVLYIGNHLNIPVIFDNLHHKINCIDEKSDCFWVNECNKTWKCSDGKQKIHFSQQDPHKKGGAHSNSININEFMTFYDKIKDIDIDIMLEVKDKNLSAVKCINCTSTDSIKVLEEEWSKYKYIVLENSPSNYNTIRKLLNNKKSYPALEFYNLIEDSLNIDKVKGNCINAAMHVWGYFKDFASEKEKTNFINLIKGYESEGTQLKTIKTFLWKLAVKYKQNYLLNSYYFIL